MTSSIRSVAFAARAFTSSEGKCLGLIRHKFLKFIVFIALRAEPMLPGLVVSTKLF